MISAKKIWTILSLPVSPSLHYFPCVTNFNKHKALKTLLYISFNHATVPGQSLAEYDERWSDGGEAELMRSLYWTFFADCAAVSETGSTQTSIFSAGIFTLQLRTSRKHCLADRVNPFYILAISVLISGDKKPRTLHESQFMRINHYLNYRKNRKINKSSQKRWKVIFITLNLIAEGFKNLRIAKLWRIFD